MEPSERYLLAPHDVLVGALGFAALGPRTVRSRMACRTVTTDYRPNQGTHEGLHAMAVNHFALLELTEALGRDSQKASRGGSFMPGSDTIIKPRSPRQTTPRGLTPHCRGWAHRSSNGARALPPASEISRSTKIRTRLFHPTTQCARLQAKMLASPGLPFAWSSPIRSRGFSTVGCVMAEAARVP